MQIEAQKSNRDAAKKHLASNIEKALQVCW